jgi:hypothetical protein
LAVSSVRFLGGAAVWSELRKLPEIAAISSTAAMNAPSLAFDGLLKPLTFLTNCNEAARIFCHRRLEASILIRVANESEELTIVAVAMR